MNKDANTEEHENIVYDEDSVEHNSSFKKPSVEKLKKQLKACEQEKKEYLTGWQKARADLVNLRKQDEEEKKRIKSFAAEQVITDLITTVDSFDMAFSNKEAWEAVPKEWRLGVEHIYNQLMSTLKNHGLEILDPLHEEFNPEKHDAIETIEGKDGIVLDVVQKGYTLHQKIIRTAKVKVGKQA